MHQVLRVGYWAQACETIQIQHNPQQGKMKYTIIPKKFGRSPSLVEYYKPRESKSSAKFNIKVRKADLRLIDRIADFSSRSRAYVLNSIVHEILQAIINEMYAEDENFAGLLALYADEKCGKDMLSTDGWCANLYGLQPRSLYSPEDVNNTSEKHQELLRRIEAIKQ